MTQYTNRCLFGDCLELMKDIPDKSIDMILTDLPYNITNMNWDLDFPLSDLWIELKRIGKENSAFVFTCIQPFTSKLIMSNETMYKQEIIWLHPRPSNVFNAKKMFMKYHENVLVFYDKLPTFNPQKIPVRRYTKVQHLQNRENGVFQKTGEKEGYFHDNGGFAYPTTVLEIDNPNNNSLHPTQKPIELFEWFIKTYTNEHDIVLDCCAGSGTTAIACLNTNRKYLCIEKEQKYFDVMIDRINKHQQTLEVFS